MQIIVVAALAWVLYYLQRRMYNRLWDHNLRVSVSFEKNQVTEGEITYLEERVENDKWLPLPMLFLKFKLDRSFHIRGERSIAQDDCTTRNELMNIMMKQCLKRRLEIWCERRGRYGIQSVSVLAKGFFLDAEYLAEIPGGSSLTVYPRLVDIRRFDKMILDVNGDASLAKYMQEDPFLIRGVREYQIYDNPKSINWAATAKTGGMKVNLYETTAVQRGYVFLNLQRESLTTHNEVLEESIRLAKTFCYMFSKRGISSGLWTNGTDGTRRTAICVEKCGLGTEYLNEVDEALTEIVLEDSGDVYQYDRGEELDFAKHFAGKMQELSQDGVVVLISNNQSAPVREILHQMQKRRGTFLWIVPVAHTADYRDDPLLKDHMRIWRLNYEVKL